MILNKLPRWQKGLILLIIVIFVIFLIAFQINTANTATKIETTLFNTLQFIFSILFAWLLSAFIGESQFIESQRKFAIGAFRRIKEIERAIDRTQRYVSYLESDTDELVKSKVIAVKGGLASMQDTVRSSIADWSDIIGDEIQISNEIKKLKKLRDNTDDAILNNEPAKLDDVNEKITQLIESLPTEIASDMDFEDDGIVLESIESLAEQWMEEKQLVLHAFYDYNGKFGSDLTQLKIGDRLQLARGMTESRMGALMLFNDDNQQIAVVMNHCTNDCNYENFVEAFEEFYGKKLIPSVLGGNPMSVKVIEINEFDHESQRQGLSVLVEQQPEHSCVFKVIDGE